MLQYQYLILMKKIIIYQVDIHIAMYTPYRSGRAQLRHPALHNIVFIYQIFTIIIAFGKSYNFIIGQNCSKV